MRIIKEGAITHCHGTIPGTDLPHYDLSDTIEIADAQLDWVGWNHYNDCWNEYDGWTKGLAQYLREIISLGNSQNE